MVNEICDEDSEARDRLIEIEMARIVGGFGGSFPALFRAGNRGLRRSPYPASRNPPTISQQPHNNQEPLVVSASSRSLSSSLPLSRYDTSMDEEDLALDLDLDLDIDVTMEINALGIAGSRATPKRAVGRGIAASAFLECSPPAPAQAPAPAPVAALAATSAGTTARTAALSGLCVTEDEDEEDDDEQMVLLPPRHHAAAAAATAAPQASPHEAQQLAHLDQQRLQLLCDVDDDGDTLNLNALPLLTSSTFSLLDAEDDADELDIEDDHMSTMEFGRYLSVGARATSSASGVASADSFKASPSAPPPLMLLDPSPEASESSASSLHSPVPSPSTSAAAATAVTPSPVQSPAQSPAPASVLSPVPSMPTDSSQEALRDLTAQSPMLVLPRIMASPESPPPPSPQSQRSSPRQQSAAPVQLSEELSPAFSLASPQRSPLSIASTSAPAQHELFDDIDDNESDERLTLDLAAAVAAVTSSLRPPSSSALSNPQGGSSDQLDDLDLDFDLNHDDDDDIHDFNNGEADENLPKAAHSLRARASLLASPPAVAPKQEAQKPQAAQEKAAVTEKPERAPAAASATPKRAPAPALATPSRRLQRPSQSPAVRISFTPSLDVRARRASSVTTQAAPAVEVTTPKRASLADLGCRTPVSSRISSTMAAKASATPLARPSSSATSQPLSAVRAQAKQPLQQQAQPRAVENASSVKPGEQIEAARSCTCTCGCAVKATKLAQHNTSLALRLRHLEELTEIIKEENRQRMNELRKEKQLRREAELRVSTLEAELALAGTQRLLGLELAR